MLTQVAVYFDFICPFSWRAAEVIELVAEPLSLEVSWEHFSIYQFNYELKNGNNAWQLWNDPVDALDVTGGKGLLAFLASEAARKQGHEAHDAFRLGLQRAVHRDYRPLDLRTILSVADEEGLQRARFEDDLANPENRTVLANDHARAASMDFFGTPTLLFGSGHSAYFRLQELPTSQEEAIELFTATRDLLERYPYLQTLKRPRAKEN